LNIARLSQCDKAGCVRIRRLSVQNIQADIICWRLILSANISTIRSDWLQTDLGSMRLLVMVSNTNWPVNWIYRPVC